ncbi:MAG: LysE family translocator [Hyphomonadaceae bacterium]|nr:LysE family translocator [Hyphomonadaceae bacterium]
MALAGLTLDALAGFVLTCIAIELTPGPNMAYLAIVSLDQGRRHGFAVVAGVALGLALVGLAAAAGLAAFLSTSPLLYEILRWGGAAYLCYLAWEGWREAGESSPARIGEATSLGADFRRGLIVNLLNPKAAVFYVAVLPGFMAETAPVIPQTTLLTSLYVAIATGIHLLIVLTASSLRPILADPGQNRLLRRMLSLALLAVAAWFVWHVAR